MPHRQVPPSRSLAADKRPAYHPPLLVSLVAVSLLIALCVAAYSLTVALLW